MTGFPTMGGSGAVATNLGLNLARRGHDVHFLFYKKPFFLNENEKLPDITFHQLDRVDYALFSDIGSPFTIQSASKMSEIVREYNIDLIHSHYAIPHAVAAYLSSKMTNIKTVTTTHGSDTHTLGHNSSYNPAISLALRDTNQVTSVSGFLARETEDVFGLPQNSVNVVYNSIDPNQFKPYEGEKELSIVAASNFRPVKQIPLMIEMFSKLSSDFPEWKLKLIGYGPEYPIANRVARENNVRDQVEFLGIRKDVPTIIAKSSILASTSQIESFGLTIAEAMSTATPVWAPRVGGIPEISIDNENGLLFDPEDKSEGLEKLARMMSDGQLRKRLGENGRKRITEHFTPHVIAAEYEKVYNLAICC